MNVAKFSKTSFLIEHPRRLLLKTSTIYRNYCILEIIVMKKIFRKHRSNRSQVLFKIGVLKNLAKFIGEHL